ncbi:MAG: hypothetical protein B7Y75_06610 [Azorhizobium sp. 35-67-5]|nr:MAG: hypothetical protein B7Y75_06610 [Azorhizobium sp. 35-67-5]
MAAIQDENVRRHYKQDLNDRLKRLLSPNAEPRSGGRRFEGGSWGSAPSGGGRGTFGRNGGRGDARGGRFGREAPLIMPGGEISRTAVVRGPLASLPRNEALLLFCLLSHPWLMDEFGEDVSDLPFANKEADRLRRALLEAHLDGADDSDALAAHLSREDLDALAQRVRGLANPRMDWPVYPDTGAEDVRLWWSQRSALHRKAYTLSRELREAERSLGEDPSEANFAWLRDVRERLSAAEGTDALVEGFGASSGRGGTRSV